MAEIELNVLMGQCLNRRIADINVISKQIAAWQKDRNKSILHFIFLNPLEFRWSLRQEDWKEWRFHFWLVLMSRISRT